MAHAFPTLLRKFLKRVIIPNYGLQEQASKSEK